MAIPDPVPANVSGQPAADGFPVGVGGPRFTTFGSTLTDLPLDCEGLTAPITGANNGDAARFIDILVPSRQNRRMPRQARHTPGGMVYHVLNRGVAKLELFEKEADYVAFEQVLAEALVKHPTRLLAYCLMPTHWHMLLWPREDGEMTEFLRWMTHTHAMRWHAHRETLGRGHLYQGRFKSFPVQSDEHFYTVARYVERNALRSNLVKKAEKWRWSSLWRRQFGDREAQQLLTAWPLPMPSGWVAHVNQPQTEAEVNAIRTAVRRGSPYGSDAWQGRTAKKLGLESTLRPQGRPRKPPAKPG